MAVYQDLKRISVTVRLNNGTIDGVTQTVSVPVPSLDVDDYNNGADTFNQKVMNIKRALAPCLSKTVYDIRETCVYELTEE